LKGQILCEVLQAAVIDVVGSPLAKRHVFVWPTNHPERIGKLWQRMLRRNLEWPENLISLTTETAYRISFADWLTGQGRNALAGKAVKLPLWCPFGALIGGKHMEELIGRSSRIGWCIVENRTDETDLKWIQGLHEKCAKAGAALFVKGIGRKPVFEGEPVVLKDSTGADWDEWPEELRIREFPSKFASVRKDDMGSPARSGRVGGKANGSETGIISALFLGGTAPIGHDHYRAEGVSLSAGSGDGGNFRYGPLGLPVAGGVRGGPHQKP
jgi:hypothetical protein